jgi:OmpA-OmpF porin, OOP family
VRKKQVLVAVVATLAAASAGAEVTGFYAGAGVGQVELTEEEAGFEFKGNDTSFTIFGGYEVSRYFAVELAYIDGGTVEDSVSGVDIEITSDALQASILGMIPIGNVVSLYGRAGILSWESELFATDGFVSVDDDAEGEDFTWGIGMSVKPVERFKLRAEFGGAELEDTDMRSLTVSAAYQF